MGNVGSEFDQSVENYAIQPPESSPASDPPLQEQLNELDQIEARLKLDKLTSEIEKLALEKRSLQRQLSWQGLALSWAQAASVFVAALGIMTTVFIGLKQIDISRKTARAQESQAEEARASDRFDKALGRLADEEAGVRLTGVAGLRLFLTDQNVAHQNDAIRYLITAISEEKTTEVQQAILSVFADAKQLNKNAKDFALSTAIELDRTFTKKFVTDSVIERSDLAKGFLSKQFPEKMQNNQPIFAFDLGFLQEIQYESLVTRRLFNDELSPGLDHRTPDEHTLRLYVELINALISEGATSNDGNWSDIYCQHCDFSPMRALRNANFDRSYLLGAIFRKVNLYGTTFRDADLSNANFVGSDLTNADLSWGDTISIPTANSVNVGAQSGLPHLHCAILKGANLSNLPLVIFRKDVKSQMAQSTVNGSEEVEMANLSGAEIDQDTKLDRLGVILQFRELGRDYDQLSTDSKASFGELWKDDFMLPGDGVDGSPIISLSEVRGSRETFPDEKQFLKTWVMYIGQPSKIDSWMRPLLKRAIDSNPVWKSLKTIAWIRSESQITPENIEVTGIFTGVPVDCLNTNLDFNLHLHEKKRER